MDHSAPQNEPIAIIGSGCRFPGGSCSPSKLWDLLRNPRDLSCNITETGRFNLDRFYHPVSGHNGTTNSRHGYLLEENVRHFDTKFFSMPPGEAEAVDPQHRLLLEVVFEALEAAGLAMQDLSGSDTACYVGMMFQDFLVMQSHDNQAVPKYAATGIAASNASSRVSYFFDWHGPSMTIDTACSSSMVCVYEAVQALRNGTSQVAIACGTNLLLAPFMYLSLSKVGMLSPAGRGYMWDDRADGYARGEGVGAVVLKPLRAAVRDGDHIVCVIREVGMSHDGKTPGLTMPSAAAQSALIRQTYMRAGLDPTTEAGRCQFFEAHGTGTHAGDPKEAEALDAAFFPDHDQAKGELLVGSVKTVIGHTEGCAGIAGIMKAALALQHGVVPPNYDFRRLNPALERFVKHLRIPTECEPWPQVPPGQPRRASVNSFGFGGANAHCILESYEPEYWMVQAGVNVAHMHALGPSALTGVSTNGHGHAERNGSDYEASETYTNGAKSEGVIGVANIVPLVFSAASSKSLAARVKGVCDFLGAHPETDLTSLAHTLAIRRSVLLLRLSISACSVQRLLEQADAKIEGSDPVTAATTAPPSILGIFTGQGAQWPTMGAKLVTASTLAAATLHRLDDSLASLPQQEHRPAWTLADILLASSGSSKTNISDAAISQPVCTAVQIMLVDLLQAAGVRFRAVVGHSSGEIAAAYAAGFLSASDAIRVAYYRGFVAHLAGGTESGEKGGMLAVGMGLADAEELCHTENIAGRLVVAAHNAPGSVTLSGNVDCVGRAAELLAKQGKFARKLRVDTAYHSPHMLRCAGPYLELMAGADIRPLSPGTDAPQWYSSVHARAMAVGEEGLDGQYWVDNLVHPVRFYPAIEAACAAMPDTVFNFALEIGPHPTLQGPALESLMAITGHTIPYSGTLRRGADDAEAFADALGTLWVRFGPAHGIDLGAFQRTCQPDVPITHVIDLPTYPWSHETEYWAESRRVRLLTTQPGAWHDLLGLLEPDGLVDELRWRNTLNQRDLPWLAGHALQGQAVFPATGYICMAAEAALTLARDQPIAWLDIHDLEICKGIVVDGDQGVEVVFSLKKITRSAGVLTAEFAIFSAAQDVAQLRLSCRGSVRLQLNGDHGSRLSAREPQLPSLVTLDVDRFYQAMREDAGFAYEGVFRGLTSIKRRLRYSTVVAKIPAYSATETRLLFHPAMLDCALQGLNAAFAAPGEGSLHGIVAPTFCERITLLPELLRQTKPGDEVVMDSTVTDSMALQGDVDVYGPGDTKLIEMEGIKLSPLVPPTAAQDRLLFQESILCLDGPDAQLARGGRRLTHDEKMTALDAERVAFFYLKQLHLATPPAVRTTLPVYRLRLLDQAARFYAMVSRGEHPLAPPTWLQDTESTINTLVTAHGPSHIEVHISALVGRALLSQPDILTGEVNILQFLLEQQQQQPQIRSPSPNTHTRDLLERSYADSPGWQLLNAVGTNLVAQICHTHPRMRILEVGAGTGGSTATILSALGPAGDAFTSYTYTDISSGFFPRARRRLAAYAERMDFAVLDVTRDPVDQGFQERGYELVVAQNVLHATAPLREVLRNVKRLLRKGGYLVLMEITDGTAMRFQLVEGSMPGWWVGEGDCGRTEGPLLTAEEWKALLKEEGFHVDAASEKLGIEDIWVALSARVVDDEVMAPLVDPLSQPAIMLGDGDGPQLLVVGGIKDGMSRTLNESTTAILAPHFGRVAQLENLTGLGVETQLDDGVHVLMLTELDDNIWTTLTNTIWNNLKRILGKAASVLWLVRDCRDKNPYAGLTLGFVRSLCYELPDTKMQTLDIGSSPSCADVDLASVVATCMLRLRHAHELELRGELADILWNVETELYLHSDGRLRVSRLRLNDEANARYNSARRPIVCLKTPSASKVPVTLVWDDRRLSHVLREQHELMPELPSMRDDMVTINVAYSFLRSVRTPAGLFLVCLGTDAETGDKTFCFSNRQASTVTVPKSWAVPIASPLHVADTAFMSHAVADLLVQCVLQLLPQEGRVSVLDADPVVSSIAYKRLSSAGRSSMFLSSRKPDDSAESVDQITPKPFYLHPYGPRRVIDAAVPMDVTLFVDASDPSDEGLTKLRTRIQAALRPACERIQLYSKTGRLASALSSAAPDSVRQLLRQVGQLAAHFHQQSVLPITDGATLDVLPLLSLLTRPVADKLGTPNMKPASLVRWDADTPAPVSLQPVHTRKDLFRSDRTYWLAGLSSSLGLSLADFMATSGAKHIAISSRSPEIDQEWLDWHARAGVSIKCFVGDVSSYESAEQTYASIQQVMPPVAGVALGAMVRIDATFMTQRLEEFQAVLRPKVDGVLNLDRLFTVPSAAYTPNEPLDFFIALSSLVGMTGNPGQSAYGAANCFLKAVMRDRREHRGLAGASIDIGRMVGVGIIEREFAPGVRERLKFWDSTLAMGESDLHQLFAEAIVAGRPGSNADPELVAGISVLRGKEAIEKAFWSKNPRLHMMLRDEPFEGAVSGGGNSEPAAPAVSVRKLLEGITALKDAEKIIVGALKAKLEAAKFLPDADAQHDTTPLVDLGVDSLVAVDIRSWFQKELAVDMPVMKILGGASMVQLVNGILEKLSKILLVNIEGGVNARTPVDQVTYLRTEGASKAQNAKRKLGDGLVQETGGRDDSRKRGRMYR